MLLALTRDLDPPFGHQGSPLAHPVPLYHIGECDDPLPADTSSMAHLQAPQAQPLLPPQPGPGVGPQQQAQLQAQSTPANTQASTPLFSVLHLPLDYQHWQQMVMAPSANIGQNAPSGDQEQIGSKQARVILRSALHEGRWAGCTSWRKLPAHRRGLADDLGS